MLAPSADPAFARDYIDLIEDRTPAPGGLADLFTSLGVRLIFGRGEEVFGQGEPADFVYRVLTGAVRAFRMMSDGRRQISEFHLAGDVFGMEAGEMHRLGAEAIGPTTVMMMRRKTLTDLAANDRVMAARVWALMAQTLQRTQDHMLRLGCQNACERLCAFLLDLADRSPPGRPWNSTCPCLDRTSPTISA